MPKEDMEEICLKHDNGGDLRFQGRLFSEVPVFDKEKNCLTHHQLYLADNGDQVYYVVRKGPEGRERHAYRLAVKDDSCVINNGKMEVELNFDMLMLAVRGLCGLSEDAMPSQEAVEKMLKAANA